jgi:hypothetical protein
MVVREVNLIRKDNRLTTLAQRTALAHPVLAVPHEIIAGHALDRDKSSICHHGRTDSKAECIDVKQQVGSTRFQKRLLKRLVLGRPLGEHDPILEVRQRVFRDRPIPRRRSDQGMNRPRLKLQSFANRPISHKPPSGNRS